MKRLVFFVFLSLLCLRSVVAQENSSLSGVRQELPMPRLSVADSLCSPVILPAARTPGLSIVTMPYQFSGSLSPQYIINWNRLGVVGDHRFENYPNLMAVQSAMLGVSRQNERLAISVYAEANKYQVPLNVTNQFGVGGSMIYRLNDHVSMTLFGMYYTSNPYFSMAAMPFTKTSRYGGYFTFKGEKAGIDLGAERYYDAFAHRWVTTPIVTPSFRLSHKVNIQLPLGELLLEGLQRLIISTRQPSPTIMPHIER